MALVLTCSKCAQRLSIPDQMRGKQVRCPKCREVYLVDRKSTPNTTPNLSSRPAPAASRAPTRPAATAQPTPRQAPAQSTASSGGSQPRTTRCPKCSVPMRLPTQAGTTTFQCPKCGTKLTVRAPQGGTAANGPSPSTNPRAAPRPTAPRAPAPRSAATPAGDSLFGDLPTSPTTGFGGGRSAASQPSPLGQNPYAAPTPSYASAAGRSSISGGGKSALLPQSLLIAIPNALALLFVVAQFFMTLASDNPDQAGTRSVVLVIFGVAAINFVVVLGGAISMLRGGPRWVSILTCLAALVPTICVSVACLGILMYPIVLGGAIWGLISLFSSSPSPAAYAGGGYAHPSPAATPAYRSAGGHLEQAQREANQQRSSGGESGSTVGAIACLVGGVVFIGVAIALIVLLCLVLMGKVEARKPFKAIAGIIFCGSTGVSLLVKGISHFQNRR
ncbi:hypothetical protein Poly21_40240 [Allorhodopirellula heiligendammensis]|uniref:Uncharacterized protein n=2 Tax=Allorhodopirellula heiligendammensis TaxID=2714739 RepID=A0A5C6BYQ4_9BACT|nr:hypothetical protein Poly21_40240 [Allorhodopirellula heiligendammensis]